MGEDRAIPAERLVPAMSPLANGVFEVRPQLPDHVVGIVNITGKPMRAVPGQISGGLGTAGVRFLVPREQLQAHAGVEQSLQAVGAGVQLARRARSAIWGRRPGHRKRPEPRRRTWFSTGGRPSKARESVPDQARCRRQSRFHTIIERKSWKRYWLSCGPAEASGWYWTLKTGNRLWRRPSRV